MSLTSFVILATAIAGVTSQATVMVNTPTSVVACLPVQLTWSGGQPPYFLTLIPGGQANGPTIEDLGQQTGTSYVWKADIAAGTSLTLQIRDSNGQLNYSDQFQVQKGSTTCTPNTTGSASTPVTTGVTTAPKTGSNTTSSTTTPSTTGSTTGSTTNTTTSSAPKTGTTGSTTGSTTSSTTGTNTSSTSPSTASGGASSSDATHNKAGVMALAVAALVAIFA